MTETAYDLVPPAAQGLPKEALEAAVRGASALDARALTGEGRNILAHALGELARAGWLRTDREPSAVTPQQAAEEARAADAHDLGIRAAALVEFAHQLAGASTLTPESAAACARLRADQYEDQAAVLLDDAPPACRVCGCTENTPCAGPCSWVPDPHMGDLCSGCVNAAVRVTVVDLETGDTQSSTVDHGYYMVVAAAPCAVGQVDAGPDGNEILTITGVRGG